MNIVYNYLQKKFVSINNYNYQKEQNRNIVADDIKKIQQEKDIQFMESSIDNTMPFFVESKNEKQGKKESAD